MSWIDQVKEKIKITTGDGVEHRPEWMNASYESEYKYTEFNFIEVPGALVARKKPIGVKYSLELIFQGPDHIALAKRFKDSADASEAPWLIEHPLYGLLTVQPTRLNYENPNSALNTTRVTGTVIETMEEPPIDNLLDPREVTTVMTEEVAVFSEESLTVTPTPTDINTMARSNTVAYRKGLPIITDAVEAERYTNVFNTAATYINTATATPLLAMRSLIAVIQEPAQFTVQVKQRIKVLVDTFNSLRANLFGIIDVSSKQIFCAEMAASVSAMCKAASTPIDGDFRRSSEVLDLIDQITGRYAQLVEDLDSLQTDNAASPLSFVANAELMIALNDLVNFTVSNLFSIALGAKQERTIICAKETNWIELAHRLYGIKSDADVNELMDINDVGLEEMLIVPKDRQVTYFV